MDIIVHRYRKKDCDRVFEEILDQLDIPPHHIRVLSSRNILWQIIIDGLITFKFYSGDEHHMAGIHNVLYNVDSGVASEFLKLRGCRAIPD